MEIQTLFASFVAQEQIKNINNEEIYAFCKKIVEEHQTNPNQRHLTSEDWNCDSLKDLKNTILDRLTNLKNTLGLKKSMNMKMTDSWATINYSPLTSAAHYHPRSLFSGVYYPYAGDDCGDLEFMTPISLHEQMINTDTMVEYPHNSFTGSIFWSKPCTGKLVIFPSWLVHYVKFPKNIRSERIVIAFNSVLE